MVNMYEAFFERVTGHRPFPYQARLGSGPWPDVVDVPTGLGKTAAVVVAWLWKRVNEDPQTPLRLVYCLPMRVLVNQTAVAVSAWIEAAAPDFEERDVVRPRSQTLMGGDLDDDWKREPERPAILVGTQDMLLSRVLMRGYGMSRYQWAIDFAFLHNDAIWAYDEVQLMGSALATSAQIEAFRRDWEPAKRSRSIWLSATLRPAWLETVDFAPHAGGLVALRISEDDRRVAAQRLEARKDLEQSSVVLAAGTKDARQEYVRSLAEEILSKHLPGTQTLVIVNRVDRAQELLRAVRRRGGEKVPSLLLHARFRQAERQEIERRLKQHDLPSEGRIVIATQAVEAGIDVTSATLFTELAPWSSMVQRFGRCNRYGEVEDGATVVWIDLDLKGGDAAPYDEGALGASREILQGGLTDVGPASLPLLEEERPAMHVIRRRDFLDLFDTDPDLSGFDVDVSPYIRDLGSPQVQVFWREFDEAPGDEQPWPQRHELCAASMAQIRGYMGTKRTVWTWDSLMKKWAPRKGKDPIVPGSVLLLRAADGGYDPEFGFDADSKGSVRDLRESAGALPEGLDDDPRSSLPRWVKLEDHLDHVRADAERLVDALAFSGTGVEAVITAALWHDVGKAHPAVQTAMLDAAGEHEKREGTFWAKSPGTGRPTYRIEGETTQCRPYFRHELASMLAWLAHHDGHLDRDLIAFLIAAHHGKVRLGLRAVPGEPAPADGRLAARGVWEGDRLPGVVVGGTEVPETKLSLDLMRMGRGPMGPSWIERTQNLLDHHGPFELAWLEALVRIADWRASAAEEAMSDE